MAATTTNPIDISRARLADLQESAASRIDALKRSAIRRVEVTAGTVRDRGLGLAYSTAAAAADGAATITRTLPIVKRLADGLEKRAESLTALETALQRPCIEDYDALNVKRVTEELEGLTAWELQKVRSYEEEHKNRKTVLGAVDRLLR